MLTPCGMLGVADVAPPASAKPREHHYRDLAGCHLLPILVEERHHRRLPVEQPRPLRLLGGRGPRPERLAPKLDRHLRVGDEVAVPMAVGRGAALGGDRHQALASPRGRKAATTCWDRSGSSARHMCELCPKMTPSAPGMPRRTVSAMAGVASSCRPERTSVGTPIAPRRATMSQSRSVPVTWNSLGPFIAWYTSGFAASFSKVRVTYAGQGSSRQTWRR